MKHALIRFLVYCQIDRLFRLINRNAVLVVMYHGVCRRDYFPPIWTQLPEEKFVRQIKFLKDNYNILTMKEFITCLTEDRELPERSALITFDDGLRNNYSVAFPILSEYRVPATIFLTMDFIGTDRILWFDELFLLLRKVLTDGIDCRDMDEVFQILESNKNVSEIYYLIVEKMKRFTEDKRCHIMSALRSRVNIENSDFIEDFGLLTWEQVREMRETNLIDFGVHTANHRILTNLKQGEWNSEIIEPKKKLSDFLGEDVVTFCYPNGRPEIDFDYTHENFLRDSGYSCAFSTGASLYHKGSNNYRVGRFPAGNDISSDEYFFRLNASMAAKGIKKMLGKK